MHVDGEIRAAAPLEAADRWLAGYAVVFDVETQIGDHFLEKISRNAFSESLRDGDPLALLDHDSGRIIGRKSAGTLHLSQDSHGLKVDIDVPRTVDGDTALELCRRGDLKGMSFLMRVLSEHWDNTGDVPLRTIQMAELFEVSAVAFPAYPTTSIGLRSLDASRKENNRSAAMERIRRKAIAAHRLRGI